MAFPCSLSNSILSVVALKYSFMILSFPLYCDIASVLLLFSHLVASGSSSGSSPSSLPHASYAENYTVVMIGVNRNYIRGGSQEKEIGGSGNELFLGEGSPRAKLP